MRWLSQVLTRLRGADSERGASATIVAVLLAGGVIMGMLAISVDLGNLTYERRQLQNSADATALALAQECAANADNCNPSAVQDLLGANSRDGRTRFDSREDAPDGACASGTEEQVGDDLQDCESAGSIADLMECPPLPDWLGEDIPYVETYTATETADGGDKLFLPFSRVLAGDASGDKGSSACARAAWGTPGGFNGALPLTFSACEWDRQMNAEDGGYVTEGPVGATETNSGYGGAGQPPLPQAGKEVVIMLKDMSDDDCNWQGKDVPGGFGWLQPKSTCEVALEPFDWANVKNGAPAPSPCSSNADHPKLKHKVIELPVFDCTLEAIPSPARAPNGTDDCDSGQGANTYYHLAGWAKFYVADYKISGQPDTARGLLGKSCTGGQRCFIGWFLSGTLADAPSIQAPDPDNDFGLHVIKPAG